jgi:hypothetical protein
VAKLVLLAPAYNRAARADAPEQVPANGAAFNTQSREEFIANWDRQVGCPGQIRRGLARFGLDGNDRLRSYWSDMGGGSPARSAGHQLGMDHRGGGENPDPHAGGHRRA